MSKKNKMSYHVCQWNIKQMTKKPEYSLQQVCTYTYGMLSRGGSSHLKKRGGGGYQPRTKGGFQLYVPIQMHWSAKKRGVPTPPEPPGSATFELSNCSMSNSILTRKIGFTLFLNFAEIVFLKDIIPGILKWLKLINNIYFNKLLVSNVIGHQ